MAPSIVAVLTIGGLLGLRHAFEPDHLAAVSTLATRPGGRRLWSAGRLGVIWGLGHTVTVGAVALLIIALGVRLPAGLWPAAELLVAAVPDTMLRLVYFAAFSAGTIVGMLGVSLTLSALVRFAADCGARWATLLHVGAAMGSVIAGLVLAQQVIMRS